MKNSNFVVDYQIEVVLALNLLVGLLCCEIILHSAVVVTYSVNVVTYSVEFSNFVVVYIIISELILVLPIYLQF